MKEPGQGFRLEPIPDRAPSLPALELRRREFVELKPSQDRAYRIAMARVEEARTNARSLYE